MCTRWLVEGFGLLARYDLLPQIGRSLQFPFFDTAHAGGSVQHGLSAAGGVYGFYLHCGAADKR